MNGEKKLKMKEPSCVSREKSAITLMWNKCDADGVEGYRLRIRRVDENEWTNINSTVKSTQIKKNNLETGVGYVFVVRPWFGEAVGDGEWGWSSTSAAMVPADDTPNEWQPFYLMRQENSTEADEPRCLTLSDILSEDADNKIERIILFTKDVAAKNEADIEDWLGQRWGTNQKKVAVDVFCDAKCKHIPKTGDSLGRYNNFSVTPVLNLEASGGHHTRMAIVFYLTGVRVAVLSCDLDSTQLRDMTHAAWVQDFPRKAEVDIGGEASPFELDLYEYIAHIQPALHANHTRNKEAEGILAATLKHLRKFDFSAAEVVLLPSVPGKHLLDSQEGAMAPSMDNLGHAKLHRLLGAEATRPPGLRIGNTNKYRQLHIDIQAPGIQALGKGSGEAYLQQLSASMRNDKTKHTELGGGDDEDGTPKKKKAKKNDDDDGRGLEQIDDVCIIWPDCANIGRAAGGYATGEWIPATAKFMRVEEKNPLFKPVVKQCLRKWDGVGTKAKFAPHLSTAYRYFVAEDGSTELLWLYLGSHDLSSASWGTLGAGSRQLHAKTYDLGVVFLPSKTKTSARAFSLAPAHRLLGYTGGVRVAPPAAGPAPPRFVVSAAPGPRDASRLHFPLPHVTPARSYEFEFPFADNVPWASDLEILQKDSKGKDRKGKGYLSYSAKMLGN